MMKTSYFFYSFFILLLLCSCSQQSHSAQVKSGHIDTNVVPAKYQFLYQEGRSTNTIKEIRERLEITSISMKRSGCLGACPVYGVTFKLDGSAQYTGKRYVDQKGKYMGKISIRRYGKLAYFIHNIGFKELNDKYRVSATDLPSVTVIVTYKNGDQKKVYSYGSNAPIQFWALTNVIDNIKNEIDWKKKE